MLATQLHKPYHERNLHKAVSFIAHAKYIICYYKKKTLCPPPQDTLPILFQPLYVPGKREHTRRRTHKCYQHFSFNRLRGYPNLRQDTNISGNMGTPGYPILRDTHISVTPGIQQEECMTEETSREINCEGGAGQK